MCGTRLAIEHIERQSAVSPIAASRENTFTPRLHTLLFREQQISWQVHGRHVVRDNVARYCRRRVSSEILGRYEGNGKGCISEVSQLSRAVANASGVR